MSMAADFALYFRQNTLYMVLILTLAILALEWNQPTMAGELSAFLGFKAHRLVGLAAWWLADFIARKDVFVAVVVTPYLLSVASAAWLPGFRKLFFGALADLATLVDAEVEVTLFSAR